MYPFSTGNEDCYCGMRSGPPALSAFYVEVDESFHGSVESSTLPCRGSFHRRFRGSLVLEEASTQVFSESFHGIYFHRNIHGSFRGSKFASTEALTDAFPEGFVEENLLSRKLSRKLSW